MCLFIFIPIIFCATIIFIKRNTEYTAMGNSILLSTKNPQLERVVRQLESAGMHVDVEHREEGMIPEPMLVSPRGNTYRGEMPIIHYVIHVLKQNGLEPDITRKYKSVA